MWLSLVERYVRDVEAAGSNPVTSTTRKPRHAIRVVEVFLFIDIFFLYSIIETGTLLKSKGENNGTINIIDTSMACSADCSDNTLHRRSYRQFFTEKKNLYS